LAVSCSKSIPSATEAAPTNTLVVIQTETPKITPTKTIENQPLSTNPVDPESIEEFWYTSLIEYPVVPFQDMSSVKSQSEDLHSLVNRMYKEHEWTDEGLKIYANNGDTFRIGKSEATENETSFSFYKNEEKTGTVYTPPGVLFYITTEGDSRLFWWCIYAPDLNTCVYIDTNFEKYITSTPLNILNIYVGDEWKPYINKYLNRFSCSREVTLWFDELYKEDTRKPKGDQKVYERVKSCAFTYRYPDNGLIYQWGPPPLPCPKIRVTYP